LVRITTDETTFYIYIIFTYLYIKKRKSKKTIPKTIRRVYKKTTYLARKVYKKTTYLRRSLL